MVKLTKIYTRSGDKGKTSLADGTRVPKQNLRVEAYGTVDETNSIIGIARSHASIKIEKILEEIQNDLFDLGADLSTPTKSLQTDLRISDLQVLRIEAEIDELNSDLENLHSFVLPGGSKSSSYLHLARTVCRRAERISFTLSEETEINEFALKYLNRLSDLLFVAARYENNLGKEDKLWKPGANLA
tara:strand:- start:479 stop:1039 length:561 start_codon:yes stop_codon:yes gene_type:complete